MTGKTILGVALLVLGAGVIALAYLVAGALSLTEAVLAGGLLALGAWLLDSPDVAAFAEKARGFVPGAKP